MEISVVSPHRPLVSSDPLLDHFLDRQPSYQFALAAPVVVEMAYVGRDLMEMAYVDRDLVEIADVFEAMTASDPVLVSYPAVVPTSSIERARPSFPISLDSIFLFLHK